MTGSRVRRGRHNNSPHLLDEPAGGGPDGEGGVPAAPGVGLRAEVEHQGLARVEQGVARGGAPAGLEGRELLPAARDFHLR